MANETLGASFSIDITALKAGLAQANRLIRESESEFKAAAAGMDDWTESQEGLEARIKHLNNAQDLQQKKVEALTKEYEEAGYASDDMSAAAVKLRTDINKEKEALAKTQKELESQTKALEELENASNDASDATSETGDAAEDAADGFTVAKGAIATFIGNGLSALTGATKDAISSMLGLAESTREYRTTMASLENSSIDAGYTAEETAASFEQLNGVLGDTQASATTTANLQAIGLEQSKLQSLTNGVIGAWAKYGDSIPIDGLGEAINHTSQLGEVQGTLADVIEWGGGTVEDFNAKLAECSSATERADLIAKMLADQGLTQAGEAWQENNKSIVDANNAQARYEKNTAALGAKIEPITTTVREGFNGILEKVLELVEGVDLDALGNKISSAFSTFIDKIMPKIVEGLKWIKDNKDIIIAGVVGIGAAFAAFKVVSLIQGVVSALNGMTVAQYALNLAMSMNPIGLVVAAITGLVAAFVVLWNKCDAFREFWIGLWDGIKSAAAAVADWFVQAWTDITAWFVQAWTDISTFFTDLWNGITAGIQAAWDWCVALFSTWATWIYDNVIAPVAQFFTDLWSGIVEAYHTVIDPWIEIFKRLAVIADEEIIQPIVEYFKGLWETVSGFFTQLWEDIKAVWNVVSGWFNDNIVQPVTEIFKNLWESISNTAQSTWDAIKNIWNVVSSWFDTNIIQPVGNFFTNMWNGLKNGAVNAWEGIKNTFSTVATFFGDIFKKAWEKVKKVFSTGGKIFDGIKDGIVKAFKTVVNAIIKGINKVVKLPFEGLNKVLDKISGLSIAGIEPFSWLTWRAPVPEIPQLARGGVVRGATTAVIGEDGAEAIVPLERNREWIREVAKEFAAQQTQGITINQTNNYKQAYTSRYEQYKSRQQLTATARLMKAGAV